MCVAMPKLSFSLCVPAMLVIQLLTYIGNIYKDNIPDNSDSVEEIGWEQNA